MYQRLKRLSRRTVGTSSTMRALRHGKLAEVILPRDTDRRVINPLVALCKERGVKLSWVDSCVTLGLTVGLNIGTSAVGILQDQSEPDGTTEAK